MRIHVATVWAAALIAATAMLLRSEESDVRWHDDLAEAAALAKKTSRPMLVVFR